MNIQEVILKLNTCLCKYQFGAFCLQVGMPTPESASAAAYGQQPGGLPYGSAPPGGAPGGIGFGVSFVPCFVSHSFSPNSLF